MCEVRASTDTAILGALRTDIVGMGAMTNSRQKLRGVMRVHGLTLVSTMTVCKNGLKEVSKRRRSR